MEPLFCRFGGKLANLPSDGTAPYALMVFAGWSFFATAVGRGIEQPPQRMPILLEPISKSPEEDNEAGELNKA
jgi:hypothetical protein